MTDPRIIPAETLDEWKADAEAHLSDDRNVDLLPKTLDPRRDIALIEYGKALAEQVESASRFMETARENIEQYRLAAEKAEAEAHEQRKRADYYRDTENSLLRVETARADAAVLRLAELKEAILDVLDKGKRGDTPGHAVPEMIRELLTEDSA